MRTVLKRKIISSDTITAIAATVIALLALFTSIWQGATSREHNRLSVKPHLDIAWIGDTANEWGIRIDNAGIGPAEILEFEVSIDGTRNIEWDTESWWTVINTLWPKQIPGEERPYFVLLRPGNALREGRELFLLKFGPTDSWQYCPLKRLSVRIKYQSIYGDRFELKSDASKHPYFQGCTERITIPSSGRVR